MVPQMGIIESVANALDRLKVSRRLALYFTLWLTHYSVTECISMVRNSDLSGSDLGLVIGAIMVPVSGLQGAAIKFYHTGHKEMKEPV